MAFLRAGGTSSSRAAAAELFSREPADGTATTVCIGDDGVAALGALLDASAASGAWHPAARPGACALPPRTPSLALLPLLYPGFTSPPFPFVRGVAFSADSDEEDILLARRLTVDPPLYQHIFTLRKMKYLSDPASWPAMGAMMSDKTKLGCVKKRGICNLTLGSLASDWLLQ